MFNLTCEERHVILFLISITLIGTGTNFFLKRNSAPKTMVYSVFELAKLNLNTASPDSLVTIPGIGEKLANRILEYREKETRFQEISELKKIKGITAYKYEQIKDYLTLE